MGDRDEELSQVHSSLVRPGEPETVQQLVAREVANLLALHKADIDLKYRQQRYRELLARYRALGSEMADVRRQMESLNLSPRQLQELKEA